MRLVVDDLVVLGVVEHARELPHIEWPAIAISSRLQEPRTTAGHIGVTDEVVVEGRKPRRVEAESIGLG